MIQYLGKSSVCELQNAKLTPICAGGRIAPGVAEKRTLCQGWPDIGYARHLALLDAPTLRENQKSHVHFGSPVRNHLQINTHNNPPIEFSAREEQGGSAFKSLQRQIMQNSMMVDSCLHNCRIRRPEFLLQEGAAFAA